MIKALIAETLDRIYRIITIVSEKTAKAEFLDRIYRMMRILLIG